MSEQKLEPCPFCGGEAFINYFPMSPGQIKHSVYCGSCGVNFWNPNSKRTTIEDAIAEWNRRIK